MHKRQTCPILILAAAAVLTAAGPMMGAAPAREEFNKILTYDYSSSRAAMAKIEAAARTADDDGRRAIETGLLEILTSPKATAPARQWVCRMLRKIGTAKSVPTLGKLLLDKEMSHMARWALQGMGCAEAGAALRDALGKLQGDLRIGVVNTLGIRADAQAVAAIGQLIGDKDKELADAALSALGRIGTVEAGRILAAAKVPPAFESRRLDSYLMCADKMTAAGDGARAGTIYRGVLNTAKPVALRVAALRGVVIAEKGKAVDTLAGLLVDDNPTLRKAAGKFIIDMPGPEATRAFAAKLGSLPPKAQLVVIGALTARGDRTAGPAVARAAASRDPAVRAAALSALGALGGANEVPLLAERAVGPDAAAARMSLLRIKGPGVEAAIAKLLSGRNEKIRMLAATTLGQRAGPGAVEALTSAARSDASPAVRKEAFDALRKLASAGKVAAGPMVDLLVGVKDASQRSAAEAAVVAAAMRTPESQGRARPVLAALGKARSSAVRESLIRVLGGIGDNAALPAIKGAVGESDSKVRTAAIRAAAGWPRSGTAAMCLKIARDASADKTHRILAIRGYITQAGLQEDISDAEVVAMYAKAIAVALRNEEKVLALSELGKVGHTDAMALAKRCASDAALKGAANAAMAAIDRALRAPAKVTASHDGGNAKNAMDGNAGTRWTSGSAMKGGEWFRIDMGHARIISGLVLDTKGSVGDYPRGYEVYISNNSRSQGTQVAKGKGTNWKTEINFKPTTGRYIKIVQTGKADGLHWSIHELEIKARPK